MTAYAITPVNGIRRKPNGHFQVWVRALGEGTTQIVTEAARNWPEALAARQEALGGRRPSAVGLCRVPFGWYALVRWEGRTYCIGTFEEETEAARVRCAFDAWAAYQQPAAVKAALQVHGRRACAR